MCSNNLFLIMMLNLGAPICTTASEDITYSQKSNIINAVQLSIYMFFVLFWHLVVVGLFVCFIMQWQLALKTKMQFTRKLKPISGNCSPKQFLHILIFKYKGDRNYIQ